MGPGKSWKSHGMLGHKKCTNPVECGQCILSGTNRQSRLQQLIDWCGGEQFNGCLIFDECHKAKHFVPVSDGLYNRLSVCGGMMAEGLGFWTCKRKVLGSSLG